AWTSSAIFSRTLFPVLVFGGTALADTNNQVLNYIARRATFDIASDTVNCISNCNGIASAPVLGVEPNTYLWSNGETTQSVTDLCTGMNSVTVTDSTGSSSTGTVTIEAPSAIQIIPTITDASCGVCADGSINLSVTGGTGSYNLLWSTSATTNAINNLSFGNYAVTVTDSVGCSITDNYQVSYSNTIQTQSTVINCYGECTGTASAAVNGIPPFIYQWNNSDTTAAINNLCAGTYIISVTDSNGVVASDTVVINELAQINFQDTTTNATCPTCTDGIATTTISGGTPPYHYNWSNGATTNTIDSLPAGTYYVTVTDDNNCLAIDTVTVGFDVGVSGQLSVNSNQLTVTPLNENNMTITISAITNTKAQLIIYNTQGQLISSKNIILHQGINHFTEPTPTAQGMYLLQLKTAGEVRNVKFIRE
ncbi:MAG: T9SS type A sorting domain-containing protein, partial [Bacteroidota bacterium]